MKDLQHTRKLTCNIFINNEANLLTVLKENLITCKETKETKASDWLP